MKTVSKESKRNLTSASSICPFTTTEKAVGSSSLSVIVLGLSLSLSLSLSLENAALHLLALFPLFLSVFSFLLLAVKRSFVLFCFETTALPRKMDFSNVSKRKILKRTWI